MLSAILTSYNTHDITAAHVREIMRFETKPDEIIVVDDAGDPGCRDLLFNLKRSVPVTYARVQQNILWNYTGARNLGIWLSRGDYLSLEDSDQIPAPTFYPQALRVLTNDTGMHKVVSQTRRKIKITELIKPLEEWKICGTRSKSIDSGLYRRSTVIAAKAFNEEFAGFYGWGAQELNMKLRARNNVEEWQPTTADYYDVSYACAVLRGSHYFVVCQHENDGLERRATHCNRKIYKLAKRRFEETDIFTHPKGILNFDYDVEVMEPNL